MMSASGWAPKRLTELAEYINGYAFKPEDWGKDGLPIIRIEQLKNPLASTDFFAGKIPEKLVIQNGDLLFSWSASLFLKIWQHGTAALNQHLFKVVEKEGVDRFFLKAFIEFYLPELTAASHGSTMKHITRKELERFSALFPLSFEEQKKIAQILFCVDQSIEQTEALIAKQQRIKTGLMQDLLTRGIDEHGQLRTEQTHAFKDSPLGRIPQEWDVVPFSHFVEKLESGVSVNADDQPCGAGQIGVLKTSAMYGGKFFPDQNKTVIYEDLNRVRVNPRKNRILISRMNTPNLVGESGFVDEDHPNLFLPDRIWMTKFRPDKEFAAKWMSFVLTSKSVRAFISLNATGTSGSMKNLPQKSLMGMQIASPSSEVEFHQITNALIQSDSVMGNHAGHLMKLRLIKTALMQDLLRGRKRVTGLLSSEAAA